MVAVFRFDAAFFLAVFLLAAGFLAAFFLAVPFFRAGAFFFATLFLVTFRLVPDLRFGAALFFRVARFFTAITGSPFVARSDIVGSTSTLVQKSFNNRFSLSRFQRVSRFAVDLPAGDGGVRAMQGTAHTTLEDVQMGKPETVERVRRALAIGIERHMIPTRREDRSTRPDPDP